MAGRSAVEYRQTKGLPMIAKAPTAPIDSAEADAEEITFHVMSPEEAWERFDRAAQHYLHMSGEAFLGAWDAGELDEDPDNSSVMGVAMLRPLGR
jgi:hypothetical protein